MYKLTKWFLVLSLLVFIFSSCVAQTREYTTLEAIAKYLSETEGGNNVNNPLNLKANIDLQNMLVDDSGWKQLLKIINTQGKFVALDLTNSRMSNTEFNPDAEFKDGKRFIVSLTLPNITESIPETRIPNRRSMFGYDSISTFQHFENLTLVIPAKVTEIGFYALSGNIKNVEFLSGSKLDKIGSIFGSSSDIVNIMNIPANITSIGQFCLAYLKNLKSVTFENKSNLSRIEYFTFHRNENLDNIIIPESVTFIGDSAFEECTNFKNIIIPANVSSIGEYAFQDCINLKSITFLSIEPPIIGKNIFSHKEYINNRSFYVIPGIPSLEVIFVPSSSIEKYKNAENWNEYSDLIKGK